SSVKLFQPRFSQTIFKPQTVVKIRPIVKPKARKRRIRVEKTPGEGLGFSSGKAKGWLPSLAADTFEFWLKRGLLGSTAETSAVKNDRKRQTPRAKPNARGRFKGF